MEPESSVMLESCGEDSVLIQTIKSIVTENSHTDLERENEGYFVVPNAEVEQENVIEVSDEESMVTQTEDKFCWFSVCRICANTNDHIIPIFEGEGLQHNLCNKIHKYLPIQVSENDTLPLHLCYHCAATLLAWHEISEGCLNAERRLLEMQEALEEKQNFGRVEVSTQDITSEPNTTESIHRNLETVKDAVREESAGTDADRWKIESNGTSLERVKQMATIDNQSTKEETEQVQYIQCAYCDIVFEDVKCFIDHTNAEHEAQMLYCQFCKLMYNGQRADLEAHISTHHSNERQSKYTIENKVPQSVIETKKDDRDDRDDRDDPNLPDRNALLTNVLDVEQFTTYTCNLCEKSFTKKSELKKHINKHSDVNRIENPEETELVNKAKQIIDDRVSYKCEVCEKIIFTKRGFLRHIRVHSDKRPCKCEQCGKAYRIEQDLARHIRDVHEGLKKYACDICGRAFANKGAKDDHRRIHTGERPYACEHCPKMFRTLNSIYIHNRVHTDYKPHKCSYCGKHFRSKQRLTHHETTHTGIKAFACEICGKTFSVKGEVVRHRAIHNEEKPYDCKCGMKFGQKRYLRNHIKQHHKDTSSWLLAELLGNNN